VLIPSQAFGTNDKCVALLLIQLYALGAPLTMSWTPVTPIQTLTYADAGAHWPQMPCNLLCWNKCTFTMRAAVGKVSECILCACTAAVKSLHPNMCIAVHCSILFHPQLPWYRESAHHWELRDQV